MSLNSLTVKESEARAYVVVGVHCFVNICKKMQYIKHAIYW